MSRPRLSEDAPLGLWRCRYESSTRLGHDGWLRVSHARPTKWAMSMERRPPLGHLLSCLLYLDPEAT